MFTVHRSRLTVHNKYIEAVFIRELRTVNREPIGSLSK